MQAVIAAHKLSGEQRRRAAVHLLRRPLLLNDAIVQQQNTIGDGHCFILIVGDHQRRQAQLNDQLAQKHPRLFAQLGVKVGERFIQQDHRRVVNQRPTDGHPLLLATGELVRMAVAKVPQPQLIQHTLHPLFYLPGGHFTQLQRIGHIVEHRFVRPQGIGLEHQAEVTLFGRDLAARRAVVHRAVADGDPSARRFFQPGHRPQQRGFPASRRPQQRYYLPPAERHGHPLQHRVVAIGEMQIFYR